jgi:hypothetical protein
MPPKKKRPYETLSNRNDFTAELQLGKLLWKSIKCLNMPLRVGLDPTMPNVFTEPTLSNLSFGHTEDYDSSMIIKYLDKIEMMCPDAVRTWNAKFPDRNLSLKELRTSYEESLGSLVQASGVKSEEDLGKIVITASMIRRNRHRPTWGYKESDGESTSTSSKSRAL